MLHTCGRYLKIIGLDFTIGTKHFWNHIAENFNSQRVHEYIRHFAYHVKQKTELKFYNQNVYNKPE